jgi:hypothetical protein
MVSKSPIGVAVAAGTGLAIGLSFLCLGPGKRRRNTSNGVLLLEPLLDRLDCIETRLSAVETRPVSLANSVSLAEPDLRIQQQTKAIEALQAQMSETRQRIAADAALVERRFAEVVKKEDPAIFESMLDTTISLRVEDLRVRLQAEMLESVEATLTKFERTIDDKVSSRISTIEKTLTDQSAMIAALSQRETESDAHLQQLISSVERLCERTDSLFSRHDALKRALSRSVFLTPPPIKRWPAVTKTSGLYGFRL